MNNYHLTGDDIDGQSFAEWWRHMGKPETVRFVTAAFVATHGEDIPQSVIDAALRSMSHYPRYGTEDEPRPGTNCGCGLPWPCELVWTPMAHVHKSMGTLYGTAVEDVSGCPEPHEWDDRTEWEKAADALADAVEKFDDSLEDAVALEMSFATEDTYEPVLLALQAYRGRKP